MSDLRVAQQTGAFGLATVVFWLSQLPLYSIDNPPSVYDRLAFARHVKAISSIALTIVLDLGVYVSMMVFATGVRWYVSTGGHAIKGRITRIHPIGCTGGPRS